MEKENGMQSEKRRKSERTKVKRQDRKTIDLSFLAVLFSLSLPPPCFFSCVCDIILLLSVSVGTPHPLASFSHPLSLSLSLSLCLRLQTVPNVGHPVWKLPSLSLSPLPFIHYTSFSSTGAGISAHQVPVCWTARLAGYHYTGYDFIAS